MEGCDFVNRLPHTSCLLVLHYDFWRFLDLAVLNIASPLTAAQHHSHTNGSLQFRARRFFGHTTFKCLAQVQELAIGVKRHHGHQLEIFTARPSAEVASKCPHRPRRLASFPFDPYRLSKSICCQSCRARFSSHKWTCPCDKSWHHCTLDFPVLCDAARPRNLSSHAIAPRSATESARALGQLETNLTNRPLMGPKLAAKFGHLLQSSPSASRAVKVS